MFPSIFLPKIDKILGEFFGVQFVYLAKVGRQKSSPIYWAAKKKSDVLSKSKPVRQKLKAFPRKRPWWDF